MDDGHHDDDGVWSEATTQQNPTTKKTNAADAGAATALPFCC